MGHVLVSGVVGEERDGVGMGRYSCAYLAQLYNSKQNVHKCNVWCSSNVSKKNQYLQHVTGWNGS